MSGISPEQLQKIMLIMAGPNGAGKSATLKIMLVAYRIDKKDFKDTDAETLKRNNNIYNDETYKATQKQIDAEKDEIIKEAKKSFGFETVLGSKRHIDFVKRAKARGYTIIVAYMALDSKFRSMDRVLRRKLAGGLNIMSDESIAAVFPLSKEHLMDIIPLADKFEIYDNSGPKGSEPLRCLSGELGKITYENIAMPAHIKLFRDFIKDPSLGKAYLHSLDKQLDAKALEEIENSSPPKSPPSI
jgi:predicted ABC-type ATPase